MSPRFLGAVRGSRANDWLTTAVCRAEHRRHISVPKVVELVTISPAIVQCRGEGAGTVRRCLSFVVHALVGAASVSATRRVGIVDAAPATTTRRARSSDG